MKLANNEGDDDPDDNLGLSALEEPVMHNNLPLIATMYNVRVSILKNDTQIVTPLLLKVFTSNTSIQCDDLLVHTHLHALAPPSSDFPNNTLYTVQKYCDQPVPAR